MSLRAAIDTNPARWLEVLSRQPGAEVHDGWVVTDVPFALCNSVLFPAWPGEEADARIDTILAAGRARGVQQLWWLGTRCEPPDLVERLEARGAVVDAEAMPGMARDLAGLGAVPVPPELRIAAVADSPGLDAFAIPFGAGFGLQGAALDSIVAGFAAAGDVARHHVGFVDGAPVACATTLVADGVAGLYDVATVPAARGRGYGAALTVAALAAARDAGATGAVLHASPSGAGIYERLGFRTLVEVHTVVTA